MSEDDYYSQLNARMEQVASAWKEFGLAFVEHSRQVIEVIIDFGLKWRRMMLAQRLGGSKFAWWIANHFPKRWLPKLELPNEENPTD